MTSLLLRTAQQSTILKIIPMICLRKKKKTVKSGELHVTFGNGSQWPTHHDPSDADANVANDVEFTVEEILDSCLTVLHNVQDDTMTMCMSSEKYHRVQEKYSDPLRFELNLFCHHCRNYH